MVQPHRVEKRNVEEEFSFRNYFVPFTTAKAITWIALIGFVVYFNVLFNGFVWDDNTFIIVNPDIHAFNLFHLFAQNKFNGGSYYRPFSAVYFSLLWNFFGNMAFFYHLTQILLHILSACLVFYFLKRYLSIAISFFLVVIFLIHPIQVESVAYIGATQSELLFITGMSALLISIRDSVSQKSLFAMSFFLLLSLLTKETGILFFILILLYQFFYDRNRIKSFLPYILVPVVIYIPIRFLYAKIYVSKITTGPLGSLSLLQRIIEIPAIVFYYIKTFFYPAFLAIDQDWTSTSLTLTQFYLPLAIDSLFFFVTGAIGFYCYKKNRKYFKLYLFFLIWFLMGLGLHLQIFPLDMTVADRWFYLPIVGLLGIFGVALQNLQVKKKYKSVLIILALVCIVLLVIRTVIRNTNWVNEQTLYTHDMKNNFELQSLIGTMYLQKHDLKDAKHYFITSISLYQCSGALNNLGVLYQSEGNLQAAQTQYLQAVKCDGKYKNYGNLVIVLYERHKYDLAETYAKEAIRKFPGEAGMYFVLGVIEDKKGDKRDAIRDLNTGYQLSHDPQIAKAINQFEHNKPVTLPL
jgi:protein O-mannosyl-transferase